MDKKKTENPARDPNQKVPFFARYLVEQELRATTGGREVPDTTLKFPSDSDEEDI